MDITTKQNEQLNAYLREVIDANHQTNLTRIDSFEQGRLLHIEDSLAGLPEFYESPQGAYADLGTGGGFPGVPLSLVSGRPVLLVDSVKKKVDILASIIQRMGLEETVKVYGGRIEELALIHPQEYAVLTARALTALPSLIELASPLLQRGGHLISYKSSHSDEELEAARSIQEKVGMSYLSNRTFTLSDGKTERSIIVFQKVSDPLVKLPRRPGMAQKRPYKA